MTPPSRPDPAEAAVADAAASLQALVARDLTVATAESLTGGTLGGLITAVPGASAAYVGGVVSYATRVKVDVLGVPRPVVEEEGVVSARCAEAMARGVRMVLHADVGLATTGVAGPDRQEGRPVGTVFVAVALGEDVTVKQLRLPGGREEVRRGACAAVLRLLRARLDAS